MSRPKIVLGLVVAALVAFVGWWWWRNRARGATGDAALSSGLPPVSSLGGTGGAYTGQALLPVTTINTSAFSTSAGKLFSSLQRIM